MSHWSEELASEQFELFRPIIEWSAEDAAEVVNATLALLEEVYEFNPENVLDVGCGLGYHVTAFAKRGLVAHGLDVGAAFIERATEQAEAAGVGDRTSFFRRDMREVGNLNVGYDLLFSHASFGFFDDASNEALLESFHDRLDPGGVLLLKVPNKDHRLRNWSDSFVHTAETYTHAGEQEYNPQTSRLRRVAFVVENETFLGEYESTLRLYSPIEMNRMLTRIGFDSVHIFGTLDGDELTCESGNQFVLGRK